MREEPREAASDTSSRHGLDLMARASFIGTVETALRLLPEFDQVSVTTVDGTGTAVTCAHAGDVTTDLDRLQYGLGEGPCIDSIHGDVQVVAPHIQRDHRWSRYVSSASELGLRAQLVAPLRGRGARPVGALSMCSTTQSDIAPGAPLIAEVLAAQIASVLENCRELENLHRALATRKTIGVAVGMLMATYRMSEEAAFAVLKTCSSHSNVKIRDIAAQMVADGSTALEGPLARAVKGARLAPGSAAAGRPRPLPRRRAAVGTSQAPSADRSWFQLTFVTRHGRTYEMTLQAPSDTEAVRRADAALHEVDHVGIHDFFYGDGFTVRPPGRLHVEGVQAHQDASGFGLVITDPDGTVTRRQLDRDGAARRARQESPRVS